MDEKIAISTSDGTFDGFLFRPSIEPAPGLVMIPEIFGINLALREMARRYAAEGFLVLALDIFWRLERNVDLGYDEDGFKRAHDLHQVFDYDLGVADVQAGIEQLRTRPECSGRVGVVGFCLGGTMAYLAAARTDTDAAVGYYGTRIHNFLDDGPKIRRPLILHLGRLDHRTPPDIMRRILHAIEGNKSVSPYIYEDAVHAFANHRRSDTYNEAATKSADSRTFSFFRKELAGFPVADARRAGAERNTSS